LIGVDRRQKYSNHSFIKNKDLKINITFDITELDLICSYILSENRAIRRGNIINLRNLIAIMDLNNYGNDQERLSRISFINKGIEARLDYNLVSTDMIYSHISGGLGSYTENHHRQLNSSEVDWVNKTVSETLKYSVIYNDIDVGLSLLTRFKSTDYINRGTIVQEIEEWVNSLQVKFRKARADSASDITFSLSGENYIQAMLETYRQLSSPSNRLVFGSQALNALTGGGVEATRVYTLLGLPGEGKSSTLIDMAIQIKRYNKNYVCSDPTKRPCVVLLVMENSIKETVQRIFSMCVGEDMLNFSEEEIMDILKTKGNLTLSTNDPIDLIVKFKPNLSEDTSYLYTLCEDLEDEGYEVICLIQDYLKRIRSVDGMFGGDLRQQLGAVINEFKVFATLKNIPVITASQLNRAATSSIDEARIKNKADLVRLIGRSNVGESNLILENSDWIALIAPEYDREGNRYLGMQRVKSRYYIPGDFFCAYIPYIKNTIKFIEDFYSPVPVHKISMRDEVVLNNGTINSAQGLANEIREYTDFNDIKLPTDSSNMFANASFTARSVNKVMCRIVC
jgi:replicative DNA helicase